MVYGNRWWATDWPPVPCPHGCGHRVHWNPCETAETPKMPDDGKIRQREAKAEGRQ